MRTKSVSTAEFIRHFGRYHDEAQRMPLTLTKHGRASVVVLSAEAFERLVSQDDPRRAYAAGEMPSDMRDMFMGQLEQDSAAYDASNNDE